VATPVSREIVVSAGWTLGDLPPEVGKYLLCVSGDSGVGCIYIYNHYIPLLNLPLCHYIMAFLSIFTVFDFKSILSDTRIAFPDGFWLVFAQNIVFIHSLSVFVIFDHFEFYPSLQRCERFT
jgi:hypothetical protein